MLAGKITRIEIELNRKETDFVNENPIETSHDLDQTFLFFEYDEK